MNFHPKDFYLVRMVGQTIVSPRLDWLGKRLSVALVAVSMLLGCSAETAEFFCDPPKDGYFPVTVIIDYERSTAARCYGKARCLVGDETKFVGDLTLFTTEIGKNQLNTKTGEFISDAGINYKCRRQYF